MILQVDANFESATLIGFYFRSRKYVTPYFERYKRVIIKKLFGEDARRVKFKEHVVDKNVWYITGLGHGSYTQFTGQDYETLWDSNDNIDEDEVLCRSVDVTGKIIHLLSCQTGKKLGVELVKKGARAFFGYTENFRFHVNEEQVNENIINDQYADPFFKADSEIDRCIIEKMNAEEVHKKVIQLFDSLIDEWIGINSTVASRLNWDLECFCSPVIDEKWGDKKAVLEIPRDDNFWLRFTSGFSM